MSRCFLYGDVGTDCGEKFLSFNKVLGPGSIHIALATISDICHDGFEAHALLVEINELLDLFWRQCRNSGVGFMFFCPHDETEAMGIELLRSVQRFCVFVGTDRRVVTGWDNRRGVGIVRVAIRVETGISVCSSARLLCAGGL